MNEFQIIIENIIKDLNSNNEIFEKLYNIDNSYYQCNIKKEKLENILSNYKDSIIQNTEKEKIIIVYNGNPYLTLKLCLEAILNQKDIILYPFDFMIGINSFIIRLIQNSEKISNINLENDIDKIKDYISKNTKTICIDEEDFVDFINEDNLENIKFEMLEKINMYCDDDEYVELRNIICDYANNNNIALDIFDDVPKSEIIELFKNDIKGSITLILSSDKEFTEKIENEIENSKVVINKNPFDFETEKIAKNIF